LAKKKQEQTQVTQRESIAFSILYNNALFLFGVIVLGFFVFKSASAPLYASPPPATILISPPLLNLIQQPNADPPP
jgi:hypothetical protein